MSLFENASGFTIGEAHFNEVVTTINNQITITQENRTDLRTLLPYVAPGASHDSKAQYESPKCAPETRIQLLQDVLAWVEVPEKEIGIMFLKGPAGAGKSCIARSVCEQSASKGWLGASFFFWRSASTRSNESLLVTSLAYQLAERNEKLRKYILSEMAENPRIVDMSLDIQFRKLILEPSLKIPREQLAIKVIVIDGLDECNGEMAQISILQLLANVVRHERFPLGIFVTSRPELHLQEALDSKEVIFATNVISLDGIPGVSQDIRTVLQSGFNKIQNNPRFKKALRSVTLPWPSPDNIEKLIERSSGQFIYSATVLKFISNLDHNPASQLEIVLGIRPSNGASPLEDLDLLYQEILSRSSEPQRTLKVLSYVLAIQAVGRKRKFDSPFSKEILKSVLHNQNRLLIVVDQLLGLSDGEACLALNQLHSLIAVNAQSTSTRRTLKITFHHKSFQDFLDNESRSKSFYINIKETQRSIANSCSIILQRKNNYTTDECVGWLYSIFQWHTHDTQHMSQDKHDYEQLVHAGFFGTESAQVATVNLAKSLKNLGLVINTRNHPIIKLPSLHELFLWGSTLCESLSRTEVRNATDFMECCVLPIAKIFLETYNNDPQIKQHFLKLPSHIHNTDLFIQSCLFPIWKIFLKTYNNELLTKQLLLVHVVVGNNIKISECNLCQLLNISPNGSVDMLQQYNELKVLVSENLRYLREFLSKSELSGPFYSTQDDYENLFAFCVSTRLWHKYPAAYCDLWLWDTAPFSKLNLVEPKIFLETYNNEPQIKQHFLKFLSHIHNTDPFIESRLFPIWKIFLKTYNNELLTKQLLLVHVVVGNNVKISECNLCQLLNISPNGSVDMLQQYNELKVLVSENLRYLREFLSKSELSGPFYSTQDDYENLFAFCDSTKLWHNYPAAYCDLWLWDTAPFSKLNLVETFVIADLKGPELSFSISDYFMVGNIYGDLWLSNTDYLKSFIQKCLLPIWSRILQANSGNDSMTKQLILILIVLRELYCDPDYLHLNLFPDLFDISPTTQQFIRIKDHCAVLHDGTLTELLASRGPYHCTANDYTKTVTAIISSKIWLEHISVLCMHWERLLTEYGQKFEITDDLVNSLVKSAMTFCDDDVLIMKLDFFTENSLFDWLESLLGPTHFVLEMWRKTFDKARRVHPEYWWIKNEF